MDTVAAARAVQGRIAGSPVVFARVTTDSRAVARGDLFVALKGEHFDGHDFVAQAFADGAAAALVAADRSATLAGNLIEVPDPLAALGALARHWRAGFDLPVVAVVGSNGKTTTKEMIATIFREAVGGQHVLATAGNFNNAIGLPLTLLRLRGAHRLGVVEIGMNHRARPPSSPRSRRRRLPWLRTRSANTRNSCGRWQRLRPSTPTWSVRFLKAVSRS